MSSVESVMVGMIGSAFFFLYVAFTLYKSDKWYNAIMGELFFIVSLTFILGVMWTASQIAENNALSYLSTGLVPYINIGTWILIIVIILLFVKLIMFMYNLIRELYGASKDESRDIIRYEGRRG